MATTVDETVAKLIDDLKKSYPPGKGPFDDVKCVATEQMRQNKDWVGNADRCDDYDFTDYDLYGMAMNWWHPLLAKKGFMPADKNVNILVGKPVSYYLDQPARGAYVGPDRDAPKTGDEPMVDPENGSKYYTLPDGGTVYPASGTDIYVVGGRSFPRYNPKDWRAQVREELGFLWMLRDQLQAFKKGDGLALQRAIDLQNVFITYKSMFRNQWVLKVGFEEVGNPINNNGRHTYISFHHRKTQNLTDSASLVYIPSKASAQFKNAFKGSSSWNWARPGGYGRPGWVVRGAGEDTCKTSQTIGAAINYVYTTFDAIINVMSLSLSSLANDAITVAVDAVMYAVDKAMGGTKGFKTDAFGSINFVKKTEAAIRYYMDKMDQCTVTQEWKLAHSKEMTQVIDAWIAACDEVLPKVFAPATPGAKPTVVVPVTKTVVTPKSSASGAWGFAVAGGTVGAVVGGPVGAAIGAGAAALMSRLGKGK